MKPRAIGKRRPYVRPMAGWWRRNPFFVEYMIHEGTAFFVEITRLDWLPYADAGRNGLSLVDLVQHHATHLAADFCRRQTSICYRNYQRRLGGNGHG